MLTNSVIFVIIYKVIRRLKGQNHKNEIEFVTVPTDDTKARNR